MRAYFESLEHATLAPYATKSSQSQGRRHIEPLSESRTIFQHDRDRIVHSKAFRRLKHKTQVFIASESDHYRDRLTHTIEVSHISRHMARLLKLNEDMAEAIALAHDLGHTPFGHSGERELNRLMSQEGGFEHNMQSLRIVDELEVKYPQFRGLNLSFEVRHGLQKHMGLSRHPQYLGDPFVSLEAQVVNLGDEIAYNNHDLDDGLSAHILEENDLTKHVTLWREAKAYVKSTHPHLDDRELKYLINSHIISWQIKDAILTTEQAIHHDHIHTQSDLQHTPKKWVTFSKDMHALNAELRRYLLTQFYQHPSVYRMNKKGQRIISTLFTIFMEDPKLLPMSYQLRVDHLDSLRRVVADYIAGMTDVFATKEYESFS